MRYAIEAEPSKPRVREYVLGLVCCALLVAYLDSGNLGAQIVEERQEQIRYWPALTRPQALDECRLAKERSRQYATALTALLNRGTVTIGDTTEVSCRIRERS